MGLNNTTLAENPGVVTNATTGNIAPSSESENRDREQARARTRRAHTRTLILKWVVLFLTLAFLIGPLISMFIFSVRYPLTGQWTGVAWESLFSGSTQSGTGADLGRLWDGLFNSLLLCLMTVAIVMILLLPTMLALRIRPSRLNRVVEFLCLLPLALPAIVLVVGLGPIYRFIAIHVLNTDTVWLSFAYAILVLPFAYRALDAGFASIRVQTLAEAARSLGASWPTVMFRVIIPNMKQAISSAAFITIAVVLGEFTIASILNRNNLQVAVFMVGRDDAMTATAVALLAMLFGIVLLVGLDLFSQRAKRNKS